MTEQEKMKQGYIWKDDEENIALQARTKELIRKFNALPSEDMEGRENLLHDIFGNVGENMTKNIISKKEGLTNNRNSRIRALEVILESLFLFTNKN